MRFRAVPAIAAVLLTAACASTTHAAAPATSATPPASPTSAPATASPTAAPSAPTSPTGHGSKILLSTQAKNLPPGPFRITAVSCGPYTAAEQSKFGTTAKGGLVYRYANVSNSLTGAPSLDVDFLDGTTVLGDNVTGSNVPDISPGQTAEGHVDALDGSGQNLSFTGCELMQYGLRGMAAGSSFAP